MGLPLEGCPCTREERYIMREKSQPNHENTRHLQVTIQRLPMKSILQ